MSLKQQAIKGVIWSTVQSYGSQIVTLIVFLVLARLLGPEAFGLIALANLFIHFTQIFLDQGFGEAIVQKQDLEPEHLDTAFWSNIATGTILTLICILASSYIAAFFNEPQLILIIRWLSLTLIIGSFNGVQQALLRRNLDFKSLAIRTLFANFVGAALGIVMALNGFGVWSLVGSTLIDRLTGVVVLWKVSNWRPGFKVSIRHFRELFDFGINITGLVILVFLSRRLDDFLIGRFLGSTTLGYYSIAYRVLTIMNQTLCDRNQKVAMPTFSKLQLEPERFQQAFVKITQMLSLLALPLFLGVSALSPEIVLGVFGHQWEPSIPVMQFLTIAGALQSAFYFCDPALMAKGKPNLSVRLFFLNILLSTIAFVSVVRFGIVAVSASVAGVALLLYPAYLWVLHKQLNIQSFAFLKRLVPGLSASLVMVGTILTAKYFLGGMFSIQVALVVYAVLGGITYVGMLFLFAPKLSFQVLNLARSVVSR